MTLMYQRELFNVSLWGAVICFIIGIILFVLGLNGYSAKGSEKEPGKIGWILAGAFLIRFCLGEQADPRFFRYYFNSPLGRQHILSVARGAVQQNLNITNIEALVVPLPPKDEQERIVVTLSAYDDLIENNRRRMALLEESARLLYQEWFVRLRFPGHEHVRIVKGLPEGWKTGHFSEFVDYLEGPGLLNRQYRDEGIPFLNIRTIKDDDIDFTKVQYLQEGEVEAKYKHFLLAEDDHVVSSSGTLGRVVTIRACHIPVMLNTSFLLNFLIF
jgi:restriction endonuclease S subunit